MTAQNILEHENTRLIADNEAFSLYLFSGCMKSDLNVVFKSADLAIFVCLSGRLISSTSALSYHLSEKLISFALKHDCRKTIPRDVFTEILIITFSQSTLEKLIKDSGENVRLTMSNFTSCQCTVHNCNSEILALAHKLLKEATDKYWGHKISLQLIFSELLVSFVRLFTADKSQSGDRAAFQARDILDASPEKDVNLEELAETCSVSKSHLCRVFKKLTGQTVTQYLNAVRVSKACELLSETDLSIEAIALKTGFNNPSYFFRVFKKQTGKLPLGWRKTDSVAKKLNNAAL
ncbi:MAG: AraC family transcriptional regulator [Candidatus Riflebacteria bacterium]|nr:AraC family transcriptional regulator [Candidatus Riflebacteria bacterium]